MSRFAILVMLGLLGFSQVALAQPFTVIQSTEQQIQGLKRIQYVVQNGFDPMNRFGVERVVLAGPFANALTTPVILQPPLSSSASFYTLGDHADGADFKHSIAAHLARGGLDLYIYSPRETFLVPGQCADQADCAVAADWGFAGVLSDLAFLRDLAEDAHPGVAPIIGGHSLGGMVALAAVNEAPTAYAGLILSDTTLWITDPALRAGYEILCQGLSGAVASGQVLDDQLSPGAQLIVHLAQTAPDDLSPIPIFPPGTTNRQAYVLFLTTPQPGPPAAIFPPGFVLAAGSLEEDGFFNASEDRVNTQVGSFNFYGANATVRDIVCSFSGDPGFVGNLAAYTGPILVFESGLGFGALVDDSLALTGSTDVQFKSYPGFGHIDLPTSPFHKLLYELKILVWVYSEVVF